MMKRITFSACVLAAILATATSTSMAQSIRIEEPIPSRVVPAKAPDVKRTQYKTGYTATRYSKVRLPKVTGKVRALTEGKYVPGSAVSWVAHGDKRYSLCVPIAGGTVSCTPVASRSYLLGVDVQFAVKGGIELVIFKRAPGSKLGIDALANKGGYFVSRLRKAARTLSRAVVYAPRSLENAARVGATANLTTGPGSGCTGSYDDWGGYYCEGGGVEGGDGGGGGGGGYPDHTQGQGGIESGNEGDDYPAGNDNGDGPQPGACCGGVGEGSGEGGGEQIPTTNIPFPIPEGCVIVPGGLACTVVGQRPRPEDPNTIPPVVSPPATPQYPPIQPPEINWDWWCRQAGLCGGEPSIPPRPMEPPVPATPVPVESYHDDPQYQEDLKECQLAYERDWDACQAMRRVISRVACLERTGKNNEWCITKARDDARARSNR